MEYVYGSTLEELLGEAYLEPTESVDIIMQSADALSFAHSKGLIHRDLKPSNIMVTTDDYGKRLVKVLDFGIVKVDKTSQELTLSDITTTGLILGTPAYMSPEQSLARKLDQRSDIYSLGCVMFHMLSGTPPFTGTTMLQMLTQNNRRSLPSVASLSKNVPRELALILDKMLEKEPKDRYATMQELLDDLNRFKEGRGIAVKLTSSQRFLLRQVLTFLLVVVIAFGVGWIVFAMINLAAIPGIAPGSVP
jgi:serine/threonine-protein kinase